jgi:hypothetical protein
VRGISSALDRDAVVRARGDSAAVGTESDGSVARSPSESGVGVPQGKPPRRRRAEGVRQIADDVGKELAYAVDLKADPPPTVSGLSKVLGVADREGDRAGRNSPRSKPRPAAERAEVGDGRLLQEGSSVADARGKLKAGVEPDVFLAPAAAQGRRLQAGRRRGDENCAYGLRVAPIRAWHRGVTAACPSP